MGADFNGYWEGQTHYNPNQGQYLFNIYGFQGNNETYTTWLSKIEHDISRVANVSKDYDLSVNLLFWANWQHKESTIGNGGVIQDHTISFDADAQSIFWTDIVTGE